MIEKPPILSDEQLTPIERWNKLSFKEKEELISRSYYGIDKILQRFVETGCYNEENPDQNKNWCSCGKPFCYSCVACRITQFIDTQIQQAKAEVADEAVKWVEEHIFAYADDSGRSTVGFEDWQEWQAFKKTLKSKYTEGKK
jgi:hypothetical protein